ncbi:filamentous hemagglutinin N-terminal domain-containing protein [Acinetobacter qingfengensis]|uniref:Hemagglutinin n=1 Tax=Acinetobacter qingfengensis TaxID=1262585 RepID=A0A1E7R1W5_9GAMM|nr:DUF637 domain-containing protein [Acinetobacter qingfengensis]KAA8734858.1 filamentous hemagglutinin N-terminal domain-containing protein [Acinetobacter qingfengensis]OEY93300.1 hemagglutinin [Acinetobacter qingfengensis]
MNKNRYRIIYNKARCMFMAVAENAKSQSKASGQSQADMSHPSDYHAIGNLSSRYQTSTEMEKSFQQLWHVKVLVASMSLWMPLAPVYAQIQADNNANAANRAVIAAGKNAAGTTVPVVNIQTPKNGVSHNVYKQFDVLAEGAVLNNSRTGANTKTVGVVAANPFLATGEARVILNEVNSSAASRFEGNLEVAGQMADVIIANPSGINIKGGGFINANKAIFTTGKPQLNADGSIQQFVVDQGKVTVSAPANSTLGLGGNNNNANYVDIYARAVELNAQLHAKNDIQVIAGANTVSADLQNISPKTGTGTAPTLAIDVKALGGMYANNIYLMGTEKGLGVNNAGTIKAVNNLVVTSAGKIENSGTLQSTSATQGLVSVQTTQSGSNGNINSSGLINSKSTLSIDAGNDLNITANQVRIDNGVVSPLILSAQGNLNIASTAQIRNLGTHATNGEGDIYLDAKNINVAEKGSITSKGMISLSATENISSAKAALMSAGNDLNLTAQNKINIIETELAARNSHGNINLQTSNSDLNSSNITLQGATLNAGKDLNLYSSGDLNLANLNFALTNSSSSIKNISGYSGRNLIWNNTAKALPQITGKVQLQAENQLTLSATTLSSKENIQLQAGQLNLESALVSQKDLGLTVENADLILNRALTAQNEINISVLKGGITANSLTANATSGKISMLARDHVNLKSIQQTTAATTTTAESKTTNKTVLNGQKGITLGSIGDGAVSINAATLTAAQGNIQLVGGNGLHLKANTDVVLNTDKTTSSNKIIATTLNGQNISLQNNKGNLLVENTTLTATDGIQINSEGKNTIKASTLNAKGNIELFAKDHLSLQNVTASSDKHIALNSKKNIYLNSESGTSTVWTPNSQSKLTAKGILSMTSVDHVTQNTSYTGGAISLEASNALITPTSTTISFNAVDSALLKSDAKLKDSNGDLTIQTNAALTIDPKIHKLNAIGDIELISKNGALTLKGYAGTTGNGSEHVVKLNTAGGGIRLEGAKVDIQGAQLNAQKDINMISNKEDILIDGVKNGFTSKEINYKKLKLNEEKSAIQKMIDELEKQKEYVEFLAKKTQKTKQISEIMSYNFEDYPDKSQGGPKEEADIVRREILKLEELYWNKHPQHKELYNALEEKTQYILFFSNNLNGYEHAESNLISHTGNINITSNKGLSISGAEITAKAGQINLESRGVLTEQYTSTTTGTNNQTKTIAASMIIDGHTDFYDKGKETDANYSMRTLVSPTIISGDKGVNIKTVGKTTGDNLVMQATGITASNGDVKIESNKNILFDAAIEQSYDRNTTSYKKKSWGGLKKKTVTTVTENNSADAASVDINGKNISIESKEQNKDVSIDIYSGKFTAEGGKISIKSGGNLNFYTVEESSSSNVDITKKSSFAGIKYNTSKTNATRTQVTELPAKLKADYIGTKSGFDTRLVGTEFEYLKDASIEAGGKLELLAAKTTITDLLKKESNSVVWQSMQDKGSITETAKLPSFNGPTVPTFKAAGGLSVQVPVGEKDANKIELRDEILKLSNQPGNEYLKEFVNRKDVDWQQVLLTQKDWDYKSQGLTGAGAAILVMIVTMVTAGAGAAVVGALGGTATTLGGAAVTMTQAAVTSLATQASVSLVNNGGDIGKTLKDLGSKNSVRNLATSVVTAGLLSQVGTALDLKPDSSLLSDRLINNFTTSVSSTLVQTAIKGGNLGDNLEAALLAGLAGALQGELSSQIGKSLDKVDPNVFEYALHKIAHAAAGCAAAAVTKASCEAGAIGAAVGEVVASLMPDPENGIEYNDIEKTKVRNTGKVVAGVVSAYAGYDVNTAANSADIAIQNNSWIKLATGTGKALMKSLDALNNAKKANKSFTKSDFIESLKKQNADELLGMADDLYSIFSRGTSNYDRMLAAIDLVVGTDLKKGNGIASKKIADLQKDKDFVSALKDINTSKAASVNSALKLRTELSFKQAGILTNDGRLTDKAIHNSTKIDLKDPIRNPSIVSALTKDGSDITDWGKFTTNSIKMQNGQNMQIHYYKNLKTGKIDYQTKDFKVKGVVTP